MCNSIADDEFERKVNLRRITHAIFSVSMAINGLGVVETEALACEDPLSEPMSANIADMGSKLRDALALLDKVRESLEEERMPIEFSEERLLNNEWMDLDTAVSIKTVSDDGDFEPNTINDTVVGLKNAVRDPIGDPAPNLDERVEFSRMPWERAIIGQRVETLERSVGELSDTVEGLSETLVLCLACIRQIEAIDMDTVRLVSMYVGYSEGE